MDHVTVCEAEVATQWLCVWLELRSTGWSVPVSACGGLCGTGCCSRFIVYLVSRNNKLRACLLSVLFPCSACSGHPAELGRVLPCLTAGACGGGFQSRPGPCPVVLTTKPAAGEQDHLHCCLFTESLSRAWLIEVFRILLASGTVSEGFCRGLC